MTSDTPSHLAAKATERGVLKSRARLTLIGVMGSQAAPRALLMTARGRTLRVALGDRTPSGTVVAIDAQSIVLNSGQGAKRLTLPQ